MENPPVLRKPNQSIFSTTRIQEILLSDIRFYHCEIQYSGITPSSFNLPYSINTTLHRNVPYHSNANAPVMTKPPLPSRGDLRAHKARPGHLTESPEEGKRKNNRGEQKEIRAGYDILFNSLAG